VLDMIARLANRWAWFVLGTAVVVVALAGTFGASVASSLTGGNPDFVTPGSASARADARLGSATGLVPDGGVIALVRTGGPVDSVEGRAKVGRVVEVMTADPRFAHVLTYDRTKDPAMISTDGRSTYVVGVWRASSDHDYQDNIERLQAKLEDIPGVQLGGSEVVGAQVVSTVQEDLARAELLAFPLLFLLSLWIFRSLLASALPLLVGGFNVVITLLGLRVVDGFTEISIFALNLVTALGLGLAIDYGLLMVSRADGSGRRHGHRADGRTDDPVQFADGGRGDGVAVHLSAAVPLLDGIRWRAGRGLGGSGRAAGAALAAAGAGTPD
jgi:RND superfamily putative drug exporter